MYIVVHGAFEFGTTVNLCGTFILSSHEHAPLRQHAVACYVRSSTNEIQAPHIRKNTQCHCRRVCQHFFLINFGHE